MVHSYGREAFALQRYVRAKGPYPWIVRAVWRAANGKDGAGCRRCWVLTSKRRYGAGAGAGTGAGASRANEPPRGAEQASATLPRLVAAAASRCPRSEEPPRSSEAGATLPHYATSTLSVDPWAPFCCVVVVAFPQQ